MWRGSAAFQRANSAICCEEILSPSSRASHSAASTSALLLFIELSLPTQYVPGRGRVPCFAALGEHSLCAETHTVCNMLFDRALRDTEAPGDLTLRQAIQFAQRQGLAAAIRKRGNQHQKQCQLLTCIQALVGGGR